MAAKKNSYTPIVVFAVLVILWAVEMVLFSENLTSAEEARDRMAAQEEEKTEQYAELEREAKHLREYTNRMINDEEFIGQEARARLGVAEEGEIVVRPEGH